MDRSELATFLRMRRARIRPIEVGLPDNSRRRIPGLRREEVAQLAGMSVDYYIRLEQARGPHPSRQILNALARALMLSTDERAHLFHLTGQSPAPARGLRRDIPPGIAHLLSGLTATPAYVLDAKYDIVAWNEMSLVVFGDLAAMDRPNLIRIIFAHPDADHRCDTNNDFVRGSVADLRAASARYPDDESIRDLVTEMLAQSPTFARIWAEHEVIVRRDGLKRIGHPELGVFDLTFQVLHIPDRDQRLVIYTAEPGSAAQKALLDQSPMRRLAQDADLRPAAAQAE